MKRLMVPIVFLAFLGVVAPSLRAQSPCCKGQECPAKAKSSCAVLPPPACCKEPECPAKADARYTKELLDILQTTRSVDAFVVTLHLLADTDVDPRTALPVIVRHAERLGVFADSLAQDQEDDDKAFTLVMEMIDKLANRMAATHPAAGAAIGAASGAVIGGVTGACEDHCCRDQGKAIVATDSSTPILPPLREGAASACSCAPTDAEVLRALSKPCHVPGICEASRDDVKIVTEQIVDHVDEPRFFPLVGPAQLHHSQWKCTVYYDETIEGCYPCCYRVTQPHVAVVYIDKDHLHLVQPEEKKPEKAPENLYFDGWNCPIPF